MTRPAVSLVVCTTAEHDRLEPLTARLSAVLDSAPETDVVVVDNSAAGGLRLDDPRIRVERAAVRGLSAARTVGCIAARGDVLVFTDDDVEFDAGWPEAMARQIRTGEWDATVAPIRLHADFDQIRSRLVREWLAEANLDGEPHLVGAGMALHRRLLGLALWDPRIGAGHPDFAFGEETLVDLMIRAGGARIGVVPDAVVVHRPDARRVTRPLLLRLAHQKGLSGAYLAHHWIGESMPRPRLRALRRRLRLAVHRLRRRPDDAWADEELRLIEAVGTADGFAKLRTEPRAYVRQTPR